MPTSIKGAIAFRNIVKISEGAMTRYHSSVKSGKGPFWMPGIQLSRVICERFASESSKRMPVLKKVEMKTAIMKAEMSAVRVE